MRKRTVFGITMLLLVLLMSLMPVVKAATYYWDNVRFVEGYEGGWIKYPHPDRNYYGISPYNTKGVDGSILHHCQIDMATSLTIIASTELLCALIGATIAGPWGAWIGALVGGALAVIVTWVSTTYFLDELNCIWFWTSLAFINWLNDNGFMLWWKSIWDPVGAMAQILTRLYATGYLRVGAVTFLDAIGKGNPSPYPRSLTISTTSGGTTNPLPGTYSYSDGASATVTAIANGGGWSFRYWLIDWDTTSMDNPITITMNRDHTLEAHFYFFDPCPMLFVWNGSEYVEEGVLNIHAREDVVVSHTLTVTPEPEGRKYLLRLTELDLPNSHSYIDQVRLFVVDKLGNSKELQLIGAVHSEDGNVLPQLLLSDDARTDILPCQTIDLKFLAPIWQSEVEQFTFVIEGYNRK